MSGQLLNTFFLASCFLFLFGAGEVLYYKLKINVEISRKIVHIGTGLLTMLFPILLKSQWLVLFLCVSFTLILFLSLKYNLLKSINGIERKSFGSLLYPLSVYSCYLIFELNNYKYYYFFIPILILAISDPIAAFFGKKWPLGKYKSGKDIKTLMGSTMFFISAVIISSCLIIFSSNYDEATYSFKTYFTILSISLVATCAEAMSKNGIDNLSIPISSLITLILVKNFM
jgi:phytol kinase